jgi:3-oxoacyl-[acyl-carrier protein] reductase
MEKALAGKTAFVSGSGRNIGRAVAVELAKLGCNLVVNGARDVASAEETALLVREAGTEALVAIGDMGDPAAIAQIAQAALGHFGSVDIVINNAAIRPHKPFLETTDADWQAVVDVGLTAAFRTSKAFLPGMLEKRWGRIISMTGMKAIRGYVEGAHISASKHGILGLTRALSQEFGGYGITANAISPGQTAVSGRNADDQAKLATIPAGFMGVPEDIARVVAFLASPAGRYVNGQMVAVNGGEAT